MLRRRLILPWLLVLSVGLSVPATAQEAGSFTVDGKVTLADGSPAAGAAVEVSTLPERGGVKKVKAKKDGSFKVPFLKSGPYTFSAELKGEKLGSGHIVVRNIRKESLVDQDLKVTDGVSAEVEIGPSVDVDVKLVIGAAPAVAASGGESGADPLGDANAATKAGDYAKSDDLLKKLIETEPDNANAFYLLGVNAAATGRGSEAEGYQKQAMELNPALPGVRGQLGTLAYERGEKEQAVQWWQEEMTVSPGEPAPAINLGVILTDLGRNEEAIQAFEQAILLAPTEPGPYLELATLYNEAGRTEDAKAILERLETVAKPDPKRWFNVGANFSNEGNEEQAEEAYRRALAIDPEFPEANRELGFTLLRNGQFKDSIPYLEKYLALAPAAQDADVVKDMIQTARKNAK